ncbi:hypothetical protein CDAR_499571 [Caerostris darwini]|uniref:Uncharacterized protein n=1 Tax=Caerostris darwini TaxID=1538125 RepID=A0AAV4TUL6_9ARAC|nr:hypothetical protein CDAR_499571 [Caerostris darwini]
MFHPAKGTLQNMSTQDSERGEESRKRVVGEERGVLVLLPSTWPVTPKDKRLSFIDRRKPSNSAVPGHAQERPAHVAPVLRGKCLFQGQTHQGPSPMGWDRTRKSGSVRGEKAPRQSRIPGYKGIYSHHITFPPHVPS